MVSKKLITDRFYGQNFRPGQLVLAKMTSYPPWPGFVAKYEFIPPAVIRSRKDKATIPILYVPSGEYSWVKEKDIYELTDTMIEERLNNPKKKKQRVEQELDESFDLVKDGYTYEQFRHDFNITDDQDNGLYNDNDDNQEQPQLEASKPKPKPKKKVATKETDKKVLSKPTTTAVTSPSSALTTSTKKKLVLPKEANKKTKAESSPPKSRSTSTGNSEEPETKKRKIKHEHTGSINNDVPVGSVESKERDAAWRFRYLLQKGLIQRKSEVTEEDLQNADKVFKELEEFNQTTGFSVAMLKHTKLHKVLREILKKEKYGQSPYNFHEKCKALLESWSLFIEELKKEKHHSGSESNNENSSVNGHHHRDLSDVSDLTANGTTKEKKEIGDTKLKSEVTAE